MVTGFSPIFPSGIKACAEANHPVDEEPYEVNLDNHGFRDGPRTGRLRASENVSSLTKAVMNSLLLSILHRISTLDG